MNINLVPSLQIMSCVQTAIPILNNPKIRQLIDSCTLCSHSSEKIEVCNLIENMVMVKIQHVVAPLLQTVVKNCIMAMFSQIVKCKATYSLILSDCAAYVNENYKFIWKFDGTIDLRKSAKALIENESLHIKERFLLACSYCFIDDAHCLWNSMKTILMTFTPLELECHLVAKFWTEIFEESSENIRVTDHWYEIFVSQNNVFMLNYVLQLLPEEKKTPFLLAIVLKNHADANVMYFCLSRLYTYHRVLEKLVIYTYPVSVLKCFLAWPYQWNFLNVAKCLRVYLSKERFCEILWFILHKLMDQEWSDFILLEILKEFWSESPIAFKEHVKKQSVFGLLAVVLDCDMQSFPRSELYQANHQSLEQYLQQFFSNDQE